MLYVFATAVILCFFAAITAFGFCNICIVSYLLQHFFADFTSSSSNNFDLSAIYTSTISLISLWLVFYYCLSVCPVMGISIIVNLLGVELSFLDPSVWALG
jgi:hypothetical protein